MWFCSQYLAQFLNGVHLENVNDQKYLGVVLDQTINWKQHINQHDQMSECIGLFDRFREWLATDQLNTIYKVLVLSRLSYFDVVWGNCNSTLQTKIERLKRKSRESPILKSLCEHLLVFCLISLLDYVIRPQKEELTNCCMSYQASSSGPPRFLQFRINMFIKHGEVQMAIQISLCFKPNTEAGRRTFLFWGPKHGVMCT